MKTGLLSIHEEYADAIFAGTKRFELRRRAPRLGTPTTFLVYVPTPKRMLVGEIVVEKVIRKPVPQLWKHVKEGAGISKEAFDSYFAGRDEGCALQITEVRRYRRPRPLSRLRHDSNGAFFPPQYLTWLSPQLLAVARQAV